MKRLATVVMVLLTLLAAHADEAVELRRLPAGGVQSRAVMDVHGRLHVVYFSGDAKAGNLFYVTSDDAGRSWSSAVRVNSVDGSAVARGNVRGAQLAVGGDGRVHVAWNGSQAVGGFLYARSEGEGRFSVQRAMQGTTSDIDGGGDVVASGGRVYLVWHAVPAEGGGRRVFMRVSQDAGATFDEARPISDATSGCCECCGLRACGSAGDALYVLFRAARDGVERDIWCLTSTDRGATFTARRLHGWHLTACPVTTMSLAATPDGVLAAWETAGQIWMARLGVTSATAPVAAPGAGEGRKHPAVCQANGEVLLAWIEGMKYGSEGRLGWQRYDAATLRPRSASPHVGGSVPPWDLLAVFFSSSRFTLLY